MKKKKYLDESFEGQKMAAHAVANGLLNKEIKSTGVMIIQQSELDKAKARRKRFVQKYDF